MIKMHGYFRSSSSYRCRIAFNLKGVKADFEGVHLLKDGGQQLSQSYKKLNPQGLVPTVESDDMVLTQSPAILEWIEETWPQPALLPCDKDERAQVRAFCAVISCDIHPLQNLRVLKYLKADLGHDQDAVDAWCQRWIGDGLRAAEALLETNAHTRFAFGDTPGMAEVYLMPQLFSAKRFQVDLTDCPRLVGIGEACEAIDAFVDAHPANQPDTE